MTLSAQPDFYRAKRSRSRSKISSEATIPHMLYMRTKRRGLTKAVGSLNNTVP